MGGPTAARKRGFMPPVTQAQLDALTAIKVTGAVSSEDMVKVSQQLYVLTEWMQYLSQFSFAGLPAGAGPATALPPPPPKWPP